MSTAASPDPNAPAVSDIAARLREAAFVRLVGDGTGDAVAATALIAERLDEANIAYQTTISPLPTATTRETSADLTVALGRPAPDADFSVTTDPVSPVALSVAREFGDPAVAEVALALAGVLAAGADPDSELLALADDHLDRQPGVAIPVGQPADGLAHSTLVHAPFSGSVERATECAFEEPRTVASAVALAVAGDEHATSRAANAVERLLRPHICEPFQTVGGYATVLDALARERPGHAVALALGADLDVLNEWRDHAQAVHKAIRSADTGRYDGLFVVRCDGTPPVGVVARLVREFRSPEPVVLVVSNDEAALTTSDAGVDAGTVIREVATAVSGEGDGTQRRGRLRFDGADVDSTRSDVIVATRDVL